MKRKVSFFLASLLFASAVLAACPPSAPYRCVMMPNGKQVCGCGV